MVVGAVQEGPAFSPVFTLTHGTDNLSSQILHLLWLFVFLINLYFPPSLCEMLASVRHYQEMGRHLPSCRARSRERNPITQGAAHPLGASEKRPRHHPTPRHCISLCLSYRPYARCLRKETAAFASRTGALPTMRQGLRCWWELLAAPDPSTKVLLNNGICPLPDGCSDRSGKRSVLAGSHAGRWAARVDAPVMSRQRAGSTPGRARLAQQLHTGLRGDGPIFQRPKIIPDLKG